MKSSFSFLFLIVLTFSVAQNKVEISSSTNPDRSVDITYNKSAPGSFHVVLFFTQLQNARSRGVDRVVTADGGILLKLRPVNDQQGIGFGYRVSYSRGKPNPQQDSLVTYLLPFRKGTKVKVNYLTSLESSYFGTQRAKNWKAYQFSISEPDTVFNSRKGLVVEVEDGKSAPRNDVIYTSERNYILVEHKDGTFSYYKGFAENQVFVSPGDEIAANQPLGIVSNDPSGENKISFLCFGRIEGKGTIAEKVHRKASIYEYYSPKFSTSDGKIPLENNNSYTVDFEEDLLLQELTKKELKKLKKKK
jgi:hypothetical protein